VKSLHLKYKLSFLLVLFGILVSYATIIPIALDHRIDASKQIVIARVISQSSYWDETQTNIFTANRLEIVSYLKEESNSFYLELITRGGVVGADAELVFPEVSLELGKEYCLFLDALPTTYKEPTSYKSRLDRANHFQLFAHSQGVLPFNNEVYQDAFIGEQMEERTLLQRIQNKTSFTPRQPNGTAFRARSHKRSTQLRSSQALTFKNGVGQVVNSYQAGTIDADKVLVIEGGNFGNQIGSIQFPNCDTGGTSKKGVKEESDVLSWTNEEIRIKIPAHAGTGEIDVIDANGQLVGSGSIQIDWAIKPVYSDYRDFTEKTRQQVHFLNANEQGGYTIHLNTTSGFAQDADAVAAFERALASWQCATRINWELDKTGTTAGVAKDDQCVVQYSTSLPTGVLGLATTRYKAVGSRSCNEENTLWSVREFDVEMVTRDLLFSGYDWNYSQNDPTATQFDFESILLHELGHALGLGHVIDESNVMHYAILNGQTRRSVSANCVEAGVFNVENSTKDFCVTSRVPMTRYPIDCSFAVEAPAVPISSKIKLFLEGYYDDDLGVMHTQIDDAGLLPIAQPYTSFNYSGTEERPTRLTDIVDWVLIQLRAANDFNRVVLEQAVLLNKEGFLVNANGQEIIDFGLSESASYFIAIYHRSHLPIISSKPVLFSITPGLYDFTSSASSVMGESQLTTIQNTYLLSAGDFDANGIINNQDFNIWKQTGASLNIYTPADADGNGIVNNQDYNLWKANSSKVSVLR